MNVRTILILVLAISAAAATSACTAADSSEGGRGVVASFYPVYEAARQVAGDRLDVSNLTPTGAEPHDLELSPKQVDEILDARVLLYLDRGFQPAVEEAAKDRHEGVTVDLLEAMGPQLHQAKGEESVQGGIDPHIWLDPVLMGQLVDEVLSALIRADPAGRATYVRNAEAYEAQIRALDGRYRRGLADCDRRTILTSHAAFGYLAARYGLTQEAIAGLSPEAEPDPRRLSQLADLVRRDGITTIFTEELVSPRVADTLAREVGVQIATMNPLEGLTKNEQAAGEDYVGVMDRNLLVLRSALGCR